MRGNVKETKVIPKGREQNEAMLGGRRTIGGVAFSRSGVMELSLFADVGLDSFIKLRFRVDDGYRVTREPARCEEFLDG